MRRGGLGLITDYLVAMAAGGLITLVVLILWANLFPKERPRQQWADKMGEYASDSDILIIILGKKEIRSLRSALLGWENPA